MNEIISFERFMNSINLFFTDDAAEWTEINLNAFRLLKKKIYKKKNCFI